MVLYNTAHVLWRDLACSVSDRSILLKTQCVEVDAIKYDIHGFM